MSNVHASLLHALKNIYVVCLFFESLACASQYRLMRASAL